jgi:hypothetical protein
MSDWPLLKGFVSLALLGTSEVSYVYGFVCQEYDENPFYGCVISYYVYDICDVMFLANFLIASLD